MGRGMAASSGASMNRTRTTLYHFTTSARLPRILRSGELRVPDYRDAGHPGRDFVWATSDPNGERTAAGAIGTWGPEYRGGRLCRVRLTLGGDGFEPWREMVARYPGWTSDVIERYELTARRHEQSTAVWHCCPDNVPVAEIQTADARTYLGHSWRPFDLAQCRIKQATGGPADADCMGIEIDGKEYWSERTAAASGFDQYRLLDTTAAAAA
jgi:hypothetical protein